APGQASSPLDEFPPSGPHSEPCFWVSCKQRMEISKGSTENCCSADGLAQLGSSAALRHQGMP
ncbi:hypothetical protein STEG23_019683, partial [Scotinomys teguina]